MPISPFSVLRGYVSKLLPQANPDSPQTDVGVRVDRYGGVLVGATSPTDYSDADEGSSFIIRTPTIGTGLVQVAAQTSFSDTAPNYYLFNGESTTSGFGKTIALRSLRMIATAAMTSATSIQYVFTLDPIFRAVTTNHMDWYGNTTASAVAPPQVYNTNLTSPLPNFVFAMQDSATASVIAARSAQALVVARGTIGGLNLVGDVLQINFGQYEAGSMPATAEAAGQPGIRVVSEPPVLVPPGYTLVGHVWAPASAASMAPEIAFTFRAK
jgi:hypothetical protein